MPHPDDYNKPMARTVKTMNTVLDSKPDISKIEKPLDCPFCGCTEVERLPGKNDMGELRPECDEARCPECKIRVKITVWQKRKEKWKDAFFSLSAKLPATKAGHKAIKEVLIRQALPESYIGVDLASKPSRTEKVYLGEKKRNRK